MVVVTVFSPLCWASALIVVAAGLAKLVAPHTAVTMLRAIWPWLRRVRAVPLAVRVSALGEAAVGTWVLADGSRPSVAALAALYAAFTLVVLLAIRRGTAASCGCFGASDVPLGVTHLCLDVAALLACVAGLARPIASVPHAARHEAVLAGVGLVEASALAWLTYLVVTQLPPLAAQIRQNRASS